MRPSRSALIVLPVMAATIACGGSAPALSQPGGTGFSAEASSSASVRLNWELVDGAGSFLVEGRYGNGDYLPIAELPPDRTSFTHFVVPGSDSVSYRLSSRTGSGLDEIGSLSVALPEMAPKPLLVQTSAFPPTVPAMPAIPVLPTIDPSHPDPGALATAMAMMSQLGALATAEPAAPQPVETRQEIGSEGGVVATTDPNGFTYTLTLPADAVHEPTTITLTPIQSLGDSPFASGIVAGVEVDPPVAFAGPLTLTINLPSAPTGDAPLVGFAVSSLSHEMFLVPAVLEGSGAYNLSVGWGDTYGLAAATPDEIEAQAARIPSDARSQMAQQIAALRAADPTVGLEADARIAAQILQALVGRVEALSARPSLGGGAGLAAPARNRISAPDPQRATGASLVSSILWSEAIWDFLHQMLPAGTPPPPGSELARSMSDWQTRIIAELTQRIKAYLDEHDGCRTWFALNAEALRQILRSPGTPFQQALSTEYRARYGPPPSLQCEFKLQITRSAIREKTPSADPLFGDLIASFAVHSEPWTLQLVARDGKLSLQGPVGTQYDSWEWTFTNCPPTAQLRPFPSSLIWITDLALVFDADDRVSDFVLQGVKPDRVGGSGGRGEHESPEPNKCRLVKVEPGSNPTDIWAFAFSSLHSLGSKLDDWRITGEDDYTATDTIAGRVESRGGSELTEDTTMVLSVHRR